MGVDTGGAGDQGLMFGFACDETPELMPLPIMMAHKLTRRLSDVRRAGELEFLRPDGKSQVSVEYVGNAPKRIEAVVISTQHSPDVSTEELRREVKKHIIDAVVPSNMVDSQTKFHINPTGRFVVGGPHGDTGLTGRKIIVDTYGGMGRHGGGAFSGKDPTKVDRSAAYAARYLAKNVVAAGLADRCTIQIAYAIGVSDPLSVYVDTHGTGKIDEAKLEAILPEMMSLKPRGIREHLALNNPIYARTSAYGHFGREPDSTGGFTWEKTDLAAELARVA
jgi:S-adenosylmethionine synthetase